MAHFAEIDENNIVTQVIVVNNSELIDDDGNESEVKGVGFCASLFGHSNWVQTSYNENIRYNYAGVGYTYDDVNDAFIAPQPFPSWSLNESFKWESPIPYPEDDKLYTWNEENQTWDLVELE